MKTKTTIMRKAVSVFLLLMLIMGSTGFVVKNSSSADDEEFIYIILYSANNNSNKNYYVSDMISYGGSSTCSNYTTKHNFYAEAGDKFKKSVEKYNRINSNEWKIEYRGKGTNVSFPSGYFTGFSSSAEAKASKKSWVNNVKNNEVLETYFTHSCQ